MTTLIDEEASITIEKQGDYYLSGLDEYTNREYYRGEENPLTLSRFYNTRFVILVLDDLFICVRHSMHLLSFKEILL